MSTSPSKSTLHNTYIGDPRVQARVCLIAWRLQDILILREGAAAVDRGASGCLHQAFSSHEGRVPALTGLTDA